MRTPPFSQATDLNTSSGDTLSPLLAHLKHFVLARPLRYGCRIVAKFNKHNLYSIHTFYIQYTHFIFNTLILYSIHSFYIQYTHFIFNNYRNIFNSFAKTFNNLVKYSIQHLKYSVNYTVKYSMRPKKHSIKQPQNIFNSF